MQGNLGFLGSYGAVGVGVHLGNETRKEKGREREDTDKRGPAGSGKKGRGGAAGLTCCVSGRAEGKGGKRGVRWLGPERGSGAPLGSWAG